MVFKREGDQQRAVELGLPQQRKGNRRVACAAESSKQGGRSGEGIRQATGAAAEHFRQLQTAALHFNEELRAQ
eukprot:3427520-Pleurochrysis_carterae.AAC.1